jgi:hypothetical protein
VQLACVAVDQIGDQRLPEHLAGALARGLQRPGGFAPGLGRGHRARQAELAA